MTDAPEKLMNIPVQDFPGSFAPGDDGGTSDYDLAHLPLNDYGNGLRLLKRFGSDLISVNRVGWHVWDGKRYARELGESNAIKKCHEVAVKMGDEHAALRARKPGKLKDNPTDEEREKHTELMKLYSDKIDRYGRFKTSSGNVTRIKGMLSSAEPYLIHRPQDIDANPWQLNCANGTLDLTRTLEGGLEDGDADPRLCPHERADLLTKLVPVSFDRTASCPVFEAFLAKVQPDPDVRVFLQTWFGYCLSGDVSEQKLVIMHGLGSNGKSTLINTLVHIMGDYAVTLDISSFLSSKDKRGGEATPDLARLPGARLVVASEPEPGARLNESSVKVITGGERMAVRQLFQEQFEFEPSFKVVISCNHKPSIRGQDHGIWRRILIVPFNVTLTDDQKDPKLNEKLAAESAGILGWMMDGLALYRERGLVVPQAIADAIDEYRNENDPIGQFLKSCVVVTGSRSDRVQATALYEAYSGWCKENALEPMSQNALGRKLTERGYKTIRYGVRFYEGILMLDEVANV